MSNSSRVLPLQDYVMTSGHNPVMSEYRMHEETAYYSSKSGASKTLPEASADAGVSLTRALYATAP